MQVRQFRNRIERGWIYFFIREGFPKKLLFLWILSMLPLLMKCIYCRNAGCVISRATPYQSRIKVQLNSSNAKDKRSILLDEF